MLKILQSVHEAEDEYNVFSTVFIVSNIASFTIAGGFQILKPL